jgi:hypothetical protein
MRLLWQGKFTTDLHTEASRTEPAPWRRAPIDFAFLITPLAAQ